MIKTLWSFLLLFVGLAWLKMTHNPWLSATVVLHKQQLEIETSLWLVLIGLFVFYVLLWTLMTSWYGVLGWLQSGRMGRVVKLQKRWEHVVRKLLVGDLGKAIRTLHGIQKSKADSAKYAKLLRHWLQGLLYAGEQHGLDVQHFAAEDWAGLQAPKAMQHQWQGAYSQANALWQHLFQQSSQSVFFLKMWLHATMSARLQGEALEPIVQIFEGYRGLMHKHYPAFTQVVNLYLLKHRAFQSISDVIQAWKTMPRADRKKPCAQLLYAQAQQRHGTVQQTVTWLEKEIPHSWDHALLGFYATLQGVPEAQIKVLNRWLKYGPTSCHPFCYQGLAYAYARCGLWAQTQQMLAKVEADHRTDRDWHALWVLSHLMLQQFDSATQYVLSGCTLAGLGAAQPG